MMLGVPWHHNGGGGAGVAVGGCSAVGKELAQSESGSNITRLGGGAWHPLLHCVQVGFGS